jgi:DNA-binding transcriptional LysR family regulator
MELRPLRHFAAAVEKLRFARAADRFGIAPPLLSQAIRNLETQLDANPLHRTMRRTWLAMAGARFDSAYASRKASSERTNSSGSGQRAGSTSAEMPRSIDNDSRRL